MADDDEFGVVVRVDLYVCHAGAYGLRAGHDVGFVGYDFSS